MILKHVREAQKIKIDKFAIKADGAKSNNSSNHNKILKAEGVPNNTNKNEAEKSKCLIF